VILKSFQDFKKAFIKSAITTGQILHLHCKFTKPIPKPKFIIIVSTSPLLFVLINSGINPYKRKRDYLQSAQVKIKRSEYSFLDDDSYIDCSEVHDNFSIGEIIAQLNEDYKNVKMRINDNTKGEIVAAVNGCKTNTTFQKNKVTEGLKGITNT